MCQPGQPPVPATVAEAVAMAEAGLAHLANADLASLPTAQQADCLRALERMESRHTAARAGVLSGSMLSVGSKTMGTAQRGRG
jgi:hypothetical protein